MKYTIETEQENNGRWIAEIVEIPGVMKYGETREEAISQAEALALRVMADQIENGECAATPWR
ncbi:MAG: type II toxin-antitoxin system HicB family antitoxin [Ignavibacteriae bacterium]|nr:type II toxin-antitoxin system HicB family antitoxin [Ignavibacteriota bacterium]